MVVTSNYSQKEYWETKSSKKFFVINFLQSDCTSFKLCHLNTCKKRKSLYLKIITEIFLQWDSLYLHTNTQIKTMISINRFSGQGQKVRTTINSNINRLVSYNLVLSNFPLYKQRREMSIQIDIMNNLPNYTYIYILFYI